MAVPVSAHVPDRPDLDKWFEGLASENGAPCCSHIDGTTLPDVDWDTSVVDGKSHYRVRLFGEWMVVQPYQVVTNPNLYGRAVVWVYHENGKPKIRCFMPGAGL